MTSLLRLIKTAHYKGFLHFSQKIDAIYFTGDIVDHFMWQSNTPEVMEKSIADIMNLMYETFDGIPIFPTLGNHEAQNM